MAWTRSTPSPLTDNDWAYSWQKYYYKPLEVGRRLYVVPEWMRDEPVPEGRSPLYLNPGLTFGTGSHASTQLCLEGVEEHTLTGRPVLDLGCGSGILSIAALCLGASTAAAVDIDPKAVDVAYENAALNGIGRDRYTVRAGDILSDRALAAQLACQRYHLVLANIVADVIIPLSAQVPALLAEDGVFLCSGIIDTRAHEVEGGPGPPGADPHRPAGEERLGGPGGPLPPPGADLPVPPPARAVGNTWFSLVPFGLI